MTEGCEVVAAGQCLPWNSLQIVMSTLLGCGTLLGLDRWFMEVREDG